MLRNAKTGLVLLGLFAAAVLVRGFVSVALDYVWWLAIPVGIGLVWLVVSQGTKEGDRSATDVRPDPDGTERGG